MADSDEQIRMTLTLALLLFSMLLLLFDMMVRYEERCPHPGHVSTSLLETNQ